MKKYKQILLAEDNPFDRELTITALEQNNLANKVITVNDGVEALDYLYKRGEFSNRLEGNPCVILLDIKMPRLDGIEVLKKIKSDPDLKVIPVVMLTSSREESDLVTSYNLGVNAYVVKPVDFKEFIDAIKSAGLFWAITNETIN
jgi:CheY-like chemotaxis protein